MYPDHKIKLEYNNVPQLLYGSGNVRSGLKKNALSENSSPHTATIQHEKICSTPSAIFT